MISNLQVLCKFGEPSQWGDFRAICFLVHDPIQNNRSHLIITSLWSPPTWEQSLSLFAFHDIDPWRIEASWESLNLGLVLTLITSLKGYLPGFFIIMLLFFPFVIDELAGGDNLQLPYMRIFYSLSDLATGFSSH